LPLRHEAAPDFPLWLLRRFSGIMLIVLSRTSCSEFHARGELVLLLVVADLTMPEFVSRGLSEAGYRVDSTGEIETALVPAAKEASLSTKAFGNPLR
jgi:hypothetical protein